jgi:hypothetical protein
MVGMSLQDLLGAVKLFYDHHPGQHVRPRGRTEDHFLIVFRDKF